MNKFSRSFSLSLTLSLILGCICPLSGQEFETHKILPGDPQQDDFFGDPVAVFDDISVYGSFLNEVNGVDSGAVYVFRKNGLTLNWDEEQKVFPFDGAAADHFGEAIDLYGRVMVVGAHRDDDNGSDSGSAYVYRYNSSSEQWDLEQKLLASDGAAQDEFGVSVAISFGVIVVGANIANSVQGAAYVFRYDFGTQQWVEEAKLTAADGEAGDYFGTSVDVWNDVAAISAPEDNDQGTDSGSVYVFRHNSGSWTEEDKLLPDAGSDFAGLGSSSISIWDDVVVAGAPNDSSQGINAGTVYIYRFDPNQSVWSREDRLFTAVPTAMDAFGRSTAIYENSILIGVSGDDQQVVDSGSAELFAYNTGTAQWELQDTLLASDAATDDNFGFSVALSEDDAIVGALTRTETFPSSGAAYGFVLSGFNLSVSPNPLCAGKAAVFTGEDGPPLANSYLLYSLAGLGSTTIPQLGITVGLSAPVLAAPVMQTDGNGAVSWNLNIPSIGAGSSVWIQTVQSGVISNVVASTIE